MMAIATNRYEAWLRHVFDHDVPDHLPHWYFDLDAPDFEASDLEIVALIQQTFERSGEDLQRYSDGQVNQGIWYLTSPSCSDFCFALKSNEVPIEERIGAIKSIYRLYADCFAKRCSETLNHLHEPSSELNPICYMFWDISPLSYLEDSPDERMLADAVFSVLESTLKIPHRACREAALHGFGEIAYAYPARVILVIDRYLKTFEIDEALLGYAVKARSGDVL